MVLKEPCFGLFCGFFLVCLYLFNKRLMVHLIILDHLLHFTCCTCTCLFYIGMTLSTIFFMLSSMPYFNVSSIVLEKHLMFVHRRSDNKA